MLTQRAKLADHMALPPGAREDELSAGRHFRRHLFHNVPDEEGGTLSFVRKEGRKEGNKEGRKEGWIVL